MKAQILKISGCKTQKEFYKKYPSEEAFMKKHGKEFKKAQMGVQLDKAQFGGYYNMGETPNLQKPNAAAGFMPKDSFSMATPKLNLFDPQGDQSQTKMAQGIFEGAHSVPDSPFSAKGSGVGAQQIIGAATGIMDAVSAFGGQKKKLKQLKQQKGVADVSLKAAESVDVDLPNQRSKQIAQARDNMMQVTNGEDRANVLGSGTNILSGRNGRRLKGGGPVGGNPTWTQNTFAPNDIYMDSGYEPLDDNNIKQYAQGGQFSSFMDAGGTDFANKAVGKAFGNSGGYQMGSAIVGALDMIPGVGPVAGAIAKPLLGAIGGGLDQAFGSAGKIKKEKAGLDRSIAGIKNAGMAKQTTGFLNNMGVGKDGINLQNYEDGGWVSHDWQPQVIASFGGLDEQEVYDYAHEGMDSLRAGGHLRSYTHPSDRAMETAAFGGQLSLDGPGEIEVMGYNPITAATGASGEIAISRGPSHDTQDKGGDDDKTVADYAGNRVNIEGGETVVEKKDGGSVDGSSALNILGDMKIGSQGKVITADINKQTVSKILKGRDIKDVKFKHVGNDIAKMTKKLNQAEDKYIKLTKSDDPLQLSTAKAMETGITMQYKDLDKFQTSLIDLQNSYHDTAKEYGYDDTPKFLEDIKKNKVKQQSAKFGGKFTQAQVGKKLTDEELIEQADMQGGELAEVVITRPKKRWQVEQIEPDNEYDDYVRYGVEQQEPEPEEPDYMSYDESDAPSNKKSIGSGKNKDWWDKAALFANAALPYFRPSDAEGLDASQLYPEMFAMATNQVTPVQTQTFQPTPKIYSEINRQAAKNDLIAQTRAAQRQVGYNPAMQAAIAAQAYNPMQQLNEADFIANQTGRDRVYNENASMFDQAKQVNFERFDNQYKRQQEALANTKATTLAALNSISDKYAKNKLEKNTLATYENMYNYRFGPNFRAQNMNPLAQFDTQYKGASAEELEAMTALKKAQDKKEAAAAKKDKAVSRNSSIVKSYKNI